MYSVHPLWSFFQSGKTVDLGSLKFIFPADVFVNFDIVKKIKLLSLFTFTYISKKFAFILFKKPTC